MKNLLSALKAIPPDQCDYEEWVEIGMALHHEGYSCSTWDEWSQGDLGRYHNGECEKKWQTFGSASQPVTGGTIIDRAKRFGWMPERYDGNELLDWNSIISIDSDDLDTDWTNYDDTGRTLPLTPAQQLVKYLRTLFKLTDTVNYVVTSISDKDGHFRPSNAGHSEKVARLIEQIEAHPDDLELSIGTWSPAAGAWIRFNPLDGNGVRNDNVTAFRYALIESDTMRIDEQIARYQELNLPIAAMVKSGGKSVHAIVHVDAANFKEYRSRVETLYDYCARHGVVVDEQNKNPSRLSRMPGVTRNGNLQELIATNIGPRSWDAWLDQTNVDDVEELPPDEDLDINDVPPLPEPIIDGILRKGHKMLVSAASKAGKSFLLMQLAVAFAEGCPWMNVFEVQRGKVMYVNLEIDPASCKNRFKRIYQALGLPQTKGNIRLWNLRGKAQPLDRMVDKIIRRVKDKGYIAVIIDPIYKVITGDENNASDMANFVGQFDKICDQTGCAVIYCHHHSKGVQGFKSAKDRASGSGVFARDPDAQLDLVEVEMDESAYIDYHDTPLFRLESSLREFANIRPRIVCFEYPLHYVAEDIVNLPAKGTTEAGWLKNPRKRTAEESEELIRSKYEDLKAMSTDGRVMIADLMNWTDLGEQAIRKKDFMKVLKGYAFTIEDWDELSEEEQKALSKRGPRKTPEKAEE